MRLGFFGTPSHAKDLLNFLLEQGFEIVFAVTNPPKPVGRKQIVTESPVHELAQTKRIPVLWSKKIREDEDIQKQIFSFNADLHIVYAYGSILPPSIISSPNLGSWNLHGSLLPELRGASPVQSAILQGKETTGFSIQKIVKELDAGPVLYQEEIHLTNDTTSQDLLKKITERGGLALSKLLKIEPSEWQYREQQESQATYCGKFKSEDRILDFSRTGFEIHNKIRALSSDAQAMGRFRGQSILFHSSRWNGEERPGRPGEIFLDKEKRLFARGGDGKIFEVTRLQLSGKKPLSSLDFQNGMRILPGEVFE